MALVAGLVVIGLAGAPLLARWTSPRWWMGPEPGPARVAFHLVSAIALAVTVAFVGWMVALKLSA